ncbi:MULTISPECIES: threonine-phosphate decarboxylase CobD [Methylobacterium]|uniref:8-amino-7-oxononanoate synthase n=1 Tax=Methylobacterium thuringiense TaxID=1003091 RepID=A0ABQ4TGY4_9HYPH|nr:MULTISPECIES: threonine-phosphate decarboxylase CobD [Methylobacterium]TXN24337.1 threonine-phosphate decarboxylase [Methylobacterium sp. WL9]GJE53747.1 Histidinol-phosphate aminotransferase [Methylobacterium thuringiense]
MSAFSANEAEALAEGGTLPVFHGGDLDAARRQFPNAPEPWLDLSTGINPVPYPLPPFEASTLQRLPSAADLLTLKLAAAKAYGAPDSNHVATAPGSQILIETIPRLRPASRVAVVGPTYAEHAMAWRRSGHAVETVSELPSADRLDVVVAVNPNNPDGRIHAPDALRQLSRTLSSKGGLLVADEAFADLEADGSVGTDLGAGAVRLRSFGKSYGLAGLRLGFALAEPILAQRIETALGPWAVSGPAIAAGLVALPDAAWRQETATARAKDAARLDRMIVRGGGQIVGGTVLFRTATFRDGLSMFRLLGEAGIYVRRFPEAPSQLRFGLPPDKGAWCRLSRVLKSV